MSSTNLSYMFNTEKKSDWCGWNQTHWSVWIWLIRKWKWLPHSCPLQFFPAIFAIWFPLCFSPAAKASRALCKPWHSRLPWCLAIFLIMSFSFCWWIVFGGCEMNNMLGFCHSFSQKYLNPCDEVNWLGVVCCKIPLAAKSPPLSWTYMETDRVFFFFYLLYHLPSNLSTTLEYNAFTDTHT